MNLKLEMKHLSSDFNSGTLPRCKSRKMTGISRAVWEQEGEETGPAPEADSSGTAGVLPSVGGASLPLHSEIQDCYEIGWCGNTAATL